jgi:hypothetical protein
MSANEVPCDNLIQDWWFIALWKNKLKGEVYKAIEVVPVFSSTYIRLLLLGQYLLTKSKVKFTSPASMFWSNLFEALHTTNHFHVQRTIYIYICTMSICHLKGMETCMHLYLKLQACRPSKSSILIKIPSLDSRAGRCASAAFWNIGPSE